MARYARTFKFCSKTQSMVEVTPDGDMAVIEELEKDTKSVRSRAKVRTKFHKGAKWPITPEPLGIDREDIPMAMEIARSKGVPTEFTKTGEPIITSADHLRRYNRAFGFYERNSYTDCPVNR